MTRKNGFNLVKLISFVADKI